MPKDDRPGERPGRRRFRDLFSSGKKEEKKDPGLAVPASDHTPASSSVASSTERIATPDSRTAPALSSKVVQGPSQAKEGAASKRILHQEHCEKAPCQRPEKNLTPKPAIIERSLWALAYLDLQKENPDLIKAFRDCLGISANGTDNEGFVHSDIKNIASKASEAIKQASDSRESLEGKSATVRKYFESAAKVVIASNDYITSAVSANPYAALAWTGISLLLPLLLKPTEENKAAIKGLKYIATLIVAYRWQEKNYLHDMDAALDFKDHARPLYTKILEYEATLLVHIQQPGLKRWARDVFEAGDWSSRVEAIALLENSCKKVTDGIKSVRTKEWREKEQEWQAELLQQPRHDEEMKNIRTLYSKYEEGKNVNPERITGTCEWFLNHTGFLAWRESQSSRILWISADPGCGKSVLSKYLVDRKGEVLTVNSATPTVCYFFFKDGDIDRNNGAKALCAFLHQLIIQQPQLYQCAKKDFETKGEKFLSDFDALWSIFLRAAAKASGQEIICVLDALDECQEHSREALAIKLVELYSHRGLSESGRPTLKFLVTSRPAFMIVRDFKPLTSTFSEVRLRGEDESEQISREIDLVIRFKVEELGSRMDLSESDKADLQENLSKIENRTYLWLHLTLHAIRKKLEFTNDEIAVILKTIPKDVEDAYTAILERSPDRERARKLLHIVLAANRPLNLLEMNVALEINEGCASHTSLNIWALDVCETRIKNMCGLFLSVVDSKVYLIHQTAREFLIREEYTEASSGRWKKSFCIAESNLLLAKICIWYLQFRDFEEKALPADHRLEAESGIRQYQKNYGFLTYAAQHWPIHFTKAGSLPELALVKIVADRTCDTRSQAFMIWFSIYRHASDNLPPSRSHWTNLLVASFLGHDTVVKVLLDRHDVDANSNMYDGTPLSFAAENGHEAVVRLLLERHDVDINSKDKRNRTPLSWAAENGHEAVVRLLLERDDVEVDSRDNYNRTPLNYAAENGHEGIVRLLLERHDVKADSKDNRNRTPLSRAAGNGHEAVVRLLLERDDVEADSKDNYNQTPLNYAAENGHEAVVRLLLKRDDVEADSKDWLGQTPLGWAVIFGEETVVRLLLKRGAEADSKDEDNRTPLSYAAERGYETVVRLLLERGAETDSKDEYNRTSLSWAAEYGHETLVRLLLERGAEADSKDKDSRTPRDFAIARGHKAVAQLLLESGRKNRVENLKRV